MNKQFEKLGVLIDEIDNLASALSMTMLPDSIHVEALRGALPDKVAKLKLCYEELTGTNPWE